MSDVREQVRYIEKSVSTKEPRFMSRALRALVSVRRKLNSNVLRKLVAVYLHPIGASKEDLLKYLEEVGFSK